MFYVNLILLWKNEIWKETVIFLESGIFNSSIFGNAIDLSTGILYLGFGIPKWVIHHSILKCTEWYSILKSIEWSSNTNIRYYKFGTLTSFSYNKHDYVVLYMVLNHKYDKLFSCSFDYKHWLQNSTKKYNLCINLFGI